MIWTRTVAEAVALAKDEILNDIDAGHVPAEIRSFSALHGHGDANEYGAIDIGVFTLAAANKVQKILDAWLKDGHPSPTDEEVDTLKAWAECMGPTPLGKAG